MAEDLVQDSIEGAPRRCATAMGSHRTNLVGKVSAVTAAGVVAEILEQSVDQGRRAAREPLGLRKPQGPGQTIHT